MDGATPLAVILSVGIGLSLGMLGGGGSMLTVPLLVYVVGLETKSGFATSTIVVGATAAVAMVQHAGRGNVRWRAGGVFAATSVAGSYLSGFAARWIAGGTLMLLFAAMMIAAAVAMLGGREGLRGGEGAPAAELALHGLTVGLMTGMVGAGGGFVIVPALVLLAGMEMHAAVGTSLLVIALKSVASLAGYASHAPIAWGPGVWVTLCAIAGSVGGARLAARASSDTLKRAFALMLVGLAAVLAVREADREAVLGLIDLWPLGFAVLATIAAVVWRRRTHAAR